MERLQDAGLLPGLASVENERPHTDSGGSRRIANLGQGREVRGTPWFEEMIQGSDLGRIKRRRGGKLSSDRSTRVEWEITEFESGEGDGAVASTGKRKLGSLDAGDDVEMKSGWRLWYTRQTFAGLYILRKGTSSITWSTRVHMAYHCKQDSLASCQQKWQSEAPKPHSQVDFGHRSGIMPYW